MSSPDPAYIERVVKSGVTVKGSMENLVSYCEESCPSDVWRSIRGLNIEAEIPLLQRWLEGLLSTEPPGKEVQAFWFGLFNPVRHGRESCDLYISGSDRFDPLDEAAEWAVDPQYFPENRYAASEMLHNIHSLLTSANPEAAEFGDYTLCLGYACLAVSEICKALDPEILLGTQTSRAIAVGFDSGDFFLLGRIDRSGFHYDKLEESSA